MSLQLEQIFNEDRLLKIEGILNGSLKPESLTLRAVQNYASFNKGEFAGQVPIKDFRLTESSKLIAQGSGAMGQLNSLMGLQVMTLGVVAVGFAMVLYKLNKMDKKLDQIIEMIEEIKNEDVNKHVDKLKSILRTLENSSSYNYKELDSDYRQQLHLAKFEISYLKEYFYRHTNDHANRQDFKNYMLFLSMCFIADYKIDTDMNQLKLARKNLTELKNLVITYSPAHLNLFPENVNDIYYYNYLKSTVDGYLFDLDNKFLIENKVVNRDSVIIEIGENEVREVYGLLNEKLK